MARLHREKMRVVVGWIAEGQVQPGVMLPREVELVQRLGVSRGVVRECIRALEERGLVSVKHGRGATVRPPQDWQVLDPDVAAVLLAGRAGKALVAELVECRRLLEVDVAALAAERRNADDLAALDAALERMRSARADDGGGAEPEFHRALAAAAHNRPLLRMLAPLHAVLGLLAESAARRRAAVEECEALLEAVRDGDPDAARAAMRAHLESRGAALERGRPRVLAP